MQTFKKSLAEDTSSPLKTLGGSTIKRYNNNVGKVMFKSGMGKI